MSEYIHPSKATHVRVMEQGRACWNIDAADDNENYTEACWGDYNSKEAALWDLPVFQREVTPHLLGQPPTIIGPLNDDEMVQAYETLKEWAT